MTTLNAEASRQCVHALRAEHPSIYVEERFTGKSVNLKVPDELVDDVYEWFETRNIPCSMV